MLQPSKGVSLVHKDDPLVYPNSTIIASLVVARCIKMILVKKDAAAERTQSEGVRRVKGWLEDLLPDDEKDEDDGGKAPAGQETSVIVNQLACKEVGCPDVEVVMTLLRAKPRPKLMFKVYKAAADLTNDEVQAALQKALAEEQHKEHEEHKSHAHDHDDSHDHGHADGCDDCGGCGQDHGHADDDGHKSQPSSQPPTHEHDHT